MDNQRGRMLVGIENRRRRIQNSQNPITSIFRSNEKNNTEINKESMNFYHLHSEFEDDSSKYDIEVGFLIVATGKYDVFVKPLIESIERHCLPNNKKFYNIFSDKEIKLDIGNYRILPIEHKPFPYPTLYRFHFFTDYMDSIVGDQLVYIDADTLIKSDIGTEILTPITVTQHCGYVNRWGTFETRIESKCFVSKFDGKNYYGGGFYSFSRPEFERMSNECRSMVDWETTRGRIPIWHDESVINRYLVTNPPTRVLSPSYHFPESNQKIYDSWGGVQCFQCKVLLLDKNHKEMRS